MTWAENGRSNGCGKDELERYGNGDGENRRLLRLPPQALDAEKSVLGSMMLSPVAVDEVLQSISVSDFYMDANRLIFEAICHLHEKHKPVDAVTVIEVLAKRKQLEESGGAPRLLDILETTPHPYHCVFYADIVKERAERRRMIEWAAKAMERSWDLSEEPVEIACDLEEKLFLVRDKTRQANGATTIREMLISAIESCDGRAKKEGVPSGIKKLDDLTLGWQRGHLIVIGARPSIGKTALALNWILHAASADIGRAGIPSYLVSLEQPKIEISERCLAMATGVSMHAMRAGDLDSEQREKVLMAGHALADLPIWVDDEAGLKMPQIASRARFLKRRHDIGLVVIDYLQLIKGEEKRGWNREQVVGEITEGAKNMAKQLMVPVIMLAQLNRKSEESPGKKPETWHLRESGQIENHADEILLLHRIPDPNDTLPPDRAILMVKKHRGGPKADIDLAFDAGSMRFKEYDDWSPSQDFSTWGENSQPGENSED